MRLTPLAASAAFDNVEGDLKQLFIDLFGTYLADSMADASTLALPEYASETLLRKSLNDYGLVLLESTLRPATDYDSLLRLVFKTWRGRNGNGRGLAFFRTLISALYPPGTTSVVPLWQPHALPYGSGMVTALPPSTSTAWLTSRIALQVPTSVSVGLLHDLIAYSLPARFVIHILDDLSGDAAANPAATAALSVANAMTQAGVLIVSLTGNTLYSVDGSDFGDFNAELLKASDYADWNSQNQTIALNSSGAYRVVAQVSLTLADSYYSLNGPCGVAVEAAQLPRSRYNIDNAWEQSPDVVLGWHDEFLVDAATPLETALRVYFTNQGSPYSVYTQVNVLLLVQKLDDSLL